MASRAAGATLEAPEVGGYIAPQLQERMMLHLGANGFLQTAILSGDRQAVEAGARLRAQLASTEQR
eukprot:4623035-Pyramimonas_sp.AAC.1